MMEVVVTAGAVSSAKLQSNHPHQQTNNQFFTGRMPFLSPNQQCQSTVVLRVAFVNTFWHIVLFCANFYVNFFKKLQE